MPAQKIVAYLWIGWAIYWAIRAWGNKKTVHRTRGLSYLWPIALFIAVVVMSGKAGVDWNRRIIHESPPADVLGIALCVAGFAFAIWARLALGANWSGQPTLKENHELVIAGPYRYVRHPIYTGLLLAILGTAIVFGRVREFAVLAVLFASFWLKLRVEEKLMLRQFPDAYPAYRRRTKALIPGVL